jgi:riboflavin synthase
MFTGIIEEVGKVLSISQNQLTLSADKVLEGTVIGDSIAVNGICLTVTKMTPDSFTVDIMEETRRRTGFFRLSAGSRVNLERAMKLEGRMGGHLVQGHIDGTGKVIAVNRERDSILIKIGAPISLTKYVVEKGFITVDGISLTVVSRNTNDFTVSIVEHTRTNTTLSDLGIGDIVNLEADIIAKYVERFAAPASGGLTAEFLAEHGYE